MMRRSKDSLLALAAVGALGCGAGPAPVAPRLATSALPSLDRWRQHVTDDLARYWTTPDALGTPVGNFATFLCRDGHAPKPGEDLRATCPELAEPPGWMKPELGRSYTRMKSRLTFLFGVAFHITGDERYLTYARAGADWLRAHAYEADGSAISYWENGAPGPGRDQRTAQDLSYAQVGLAFYYYLTRDPAVLADLERLERYVMAHYWRPAPDAPGDRSGRTGMLRWVLADAPAGETTTKPGDAAREELVSQLDQINAYMLLVAPLIEDAQRAGDWQRDLVLLANVVKAQYFDPARGMFWGTLGNPDEHRAGGRHNDFGHSMKSLWMLYLTGQRTGDFTLSAFAQPLVAPLLARAAQPSGCWASSLRDDGTRDNNSQWWIFAELDQAAATMALRAPSAAPYADYLARSYDCWLTRFVDHQHGGVWPFIPDDWTPAMANEPHGIKAFHWKSGYHEAEHALVALITTAGLTGQSLPLYYAFVKPPAAERIQPYYFTGEIASEHSLPLPHHPELHGRRVEFRNLR